LSLTSSFSGVKRQTDFVSDNMAYAGSTIALKRIRREFKEVIGTDEHRHKEIGVEMVDNKWNHIKAHITGPPETPYEGGKFYLDIKIPDSYPFKAPEVKFVTPLWHPNVSSQTGVICLDILHGEGWAAILTLRTVLLSITALLAAPEPDNPQDAVVARQLKRSKVIFHKTAQHWTAIYASGKNPVPEFETKVKTMMELGVEERKARDALSTNNWNLERTVNNL